MKKTIKYLALVLSLVLLLSVLTLPTLAVIITQTGSIINTFLSGIEPTGSLVIHKTISHPFRTGYAIPDNDHTRFGFTVDLGEEHAGESFGSFTADHQGRFDIYVKANGSVTIPDVPAGAEATITEHTPGPGFTAPGAEIIAVSRGENRVKIENIYDPHEVPGTELTIRGQKTLVGRDWQEGDRFVFALEVLEGEQWVELGQQAVEYILLEQPDPLQPEHTILVPVTNFDRFDFTDLIRSYPLEKPGVYSFRVIEKEGTVPGITYDKMESRLDITVGDADMDGWLELQELDSPSGNTEIDDMDVFIEFENEYAPIGADDVSIEISKTLVDTSGQNKSPAGFVFELFDEDGEVIQTSQPTDANGRTEIRLIYETKDQDRYFFYTLQERNDEDRGMTYDETVYKIRVDVIGNADGSVTALIRENTAEDSAEPEEMDDESIEPAEIPTMETEPEETEPEETEPEAAVSAEPTMQTAEPESTEPAETDETPEEQEFSEPEELDDGPVSFTFTNIYEPAPATLPVSGEKHLEGRDLREDEFTFLLYRTESGFYLPEDAEPAGRATNNLEGEFSFGELTFHKAGWHYYVILEDTSNPLGGITYDESRYQLRIFVEDIGGRLSVQQASVENTAGEEADICFYNAYAPANAIFALTGRKTLEGRALEAGEFTFHLYEASYLTSYGFSKGPLLARTTNQTADTDAADAFAFRIEYPDTGTFYYIVTEKAGDEEGMTYDSAEYGIEIVVEDDLNGQLQARVTQMVLIGQEDTQVQEIQFRNEYTEPEETEPDETEPTETTSPDETTEPDEPDKPTEPSGKLPQTGQLWWPVPILLSVGILLVLIGLFRRKGTPYETKKR